MVCYGRIKAGDAGLIKSKYCRTGVVGTGAATETVFSSLEQDLCIGSLFQSDQEIQS